MAITLEAMTVMFDSMTVTEDELDVLRRNILAIQSWGNTLDLFPEGKIWSTAGIQAVGAGANSQIGTNQSRVRGGVNVSSSRVTLPIDGFYDVVHMLPITGGGTGRVQSSVQRVRSATATLTITAAGMYKADAVTYWIGGFNCLPLKAGDGLDLFALNSTASTMNVGRAGEDNSATMYVRYVRPLEGATAI